MQPNLHRLLSAKLRFAVVVPMLLWYATGAHALTTYLIQSDQTLATFEFKRFGVSTITARFEKIAGTIALDRDKPAVSAHIRIDVNSAKTGSASLDERLKSRAFLDAQQYPTITFAASSGQFSGGRLTALAGDLTIHGVTRPVAFAISGFLCAAEHPSQTGAPACEARAELAIKRSDYGISKLIPLISDRIMIRFKVHGAQQVAVDTPAA